VATIKHERMPVLLTREEEFETWLRGSADEALALAREYPADQMRLVQEGSTRRICCARPGSVVWICQRRRARRYSESRQSVGERCAKSGRKRLREHGHRFSIQSFACR
jgi:hypothetical protein